MSNSDNNDSGFSKTAWQKKDKETVVTNRKAMLSDAPAERKAFVEIFRLATGSQRFDLGSNEIFIGRSSECDIALPYDDISRKHARIFMKNDRYYIEDLESMNGIYLNDIRVERAVLKCNDSIGIGPISITFYEDELRSSLE